MNIVMIAINDPAGTAINFAKAINRLTDHTCRLITTELRYNFLFEKDLHVPWLQDHDELGEVLRTADLFHFHMTADEELRLGPYRVRDFLRGQQVVHHHHGHPEFRENPRSFANRYAELGRRAIVSTPDLLKLFPEASWIPNPVPLKDPDYAAKTEYNHRWEVLVGHSPTKKELKNTDEFRSVVEESMTRNNRIRMKIIENTPHRDCLRMKKSCDVFFDHMQGYFGVSSLEALSMGVPTIAGLDEWNLEQVRMFAGCDEVPWIVARDPKQLRSRVDDFTADLGLRESVGRFSRAWMEACWTEERIMERLMSFYCTE